MKHLLLLITLLISTITFSQTDTTYYTESWKKCEKSVAIYYRITEKQGKLYFVRDMYAKTNTPQMIAYSTMLEPDLLFEGKQTNFNEKGEKESEGNYINNKKSGIWKFWEDYNGDSLVIDCNLDGTYKNVHIPASEKYINREMNVSYKLEIMPAFVGGESELYKFISKNVVYPQAPKEKGITGTSYVTFVIEADGSISDVKLLREIRNCPECDEEAKRVINLMPKWTPGIQYGRAVRVQFNMPIKFKLR